MPAPSTSSRCPRCSAPLVEIALGRDGVPMMMRSCSACDSRWWDEGGAEVDLEHVLDRVSAGSLRSR